MKDYIYLLIITALLASTAYFYFQSPKTKTITKVKRDTTTVVKRDTTVRTVTDTLIKPEPDTVVGDTASEPNRSQLALRTYTSDYDKDFASLSVRTETRGWMLRQSVRWNYRIPKVQIQQTINTTRTVRSRYGAGFVASRGSLIGYGKVRVSDDVFINVGYNAISRSPAFGASIQF